MSHRRVTQTFHTVRAAVLLVLLSYAVTGANGEGHADFGYTGPLAPNNWGKNFETCIGKHQSPINIEEHDVREIYLPPLHFSGTSAARKIYLTNNGHTAMLHFANHTKKAFMSGGPLKGAYVFEQLHFHWGETDKEGSEDLLNNHSFSMELHAVFYKREYHTISAAMHFPDGLAVLAFFFEATGEQPNPTFELIVEALPKIEKVGSEISIADTLRLNQLLGPSNPPDDRMQNYFTYNGSLTTPPCSEVVTWIDFKYPLALSHSQVAAFRNIRSSQGHKLTHNFRPVQPLTDRLILHNFPRLANITAKINHLSDKLKIASRNWEKCLKQKFCNNGASSCNLTLLSFCLAILVHFLVITIYRPR